MDTLDLPQEQNGLLSQPEKVFRPRTANLEAKQYALLRRYGKALIVSILTPASC